MLKSNTAFACLLVSAFLALEVISVISHEMWGDELRSWAIARDSSSIANLFENLRYEGHPSLWYLSLYLLSRFTRNPVAMQILHVMLATIAIYLFAGFSPFTNTQKALFSFGYFPFYEYAAISRNYGLGILFLFSFCALFETRVRSYIPLAITLFLLANTSAYGVIIAVSLALTLLYECVIDRTMMSYLLARKWDLAMSLLVFAFGIAIAMFGIIQPSDSGQKPVLTKGFKTEWLVGTLTSLWRSYIPIPNFFSYQFWNSNILMSGPVKVPAMACAALSLGLLILSIGWLARKRVVLFLYLSGTFGILFFTYMFPYIRFFGSLRHHGHLFILFVASLWLSAHYSGSRLSNRVICSFADWIDRHSGKFMMVILCAHLGAGIIAFSLDLFNPFSGGKDASKYIEAQHMADMLIVGTEDAFPVAAYLDKKIYYLEGERFESFVVLDNRRKKVHPNELFERAIKLVRQRDADVLLVVNYNLAPLFIKGSHSTRNHHLSRSVSGLAAFRRSIVPDEQYYLYLIQRKDVGQFDQNSL